MLNTSCTSEKYSFKVGQRYELRGLLGENQALRRKLASLGFVNGTSLQVTGVAPLGCPVEFKARGYHLSLRCEEVDALELIPISLI